MAYGIIRVQKIKINDGVAVFKRARHNCREYADNKPAPPNINPDLTRFNQTFGAKTIQEVKDKIKELQAKATNPRRDAVGLLEIMVATSAGSLSDVDASAYLKASKTFIEGLYGTQNTVSVFFHQDEKTPHLHAFIVPLVEKEVTLRRTNQEKETGKKRTEKQLVLNTQKITGGSAALRKFQDKFFDEVSSRFGLKRGKPVEETKARYRRASIRAEEQKLEKQKQEFENAKNDILTGKWELPKAANILEPAISYRKRVTEIITGAAVGLNKQINEGIQAGIAQEQHKWVKANRDFAEANRQLENQNRELTQKLEKAESKLKTWRETSPNELRDLADSYEKTGVRNYIEYDKIQKKRNSGHSRS